MEDESGEIKKKGRPPKKKDPRSFFPDEEETDGLNMAMQTSSLVTKFKAYPVPVFGMPGTHQGSNLSHLPPGPRSKALTENEVRETLLRGGLDSLGMVRELKRIMMVGGLEYTAQNISLLVKSEKNLAEMLLQILDKSGKLGMGMGNKEIALSIINQVNLTIDAGLIKAEKNLEKNPLAREAYRAVRIIEATARDVSDEPQLTEGLPPLPYVLEKPEEISKEEKMERFLQTLPPNN